MNLLTQKSLWYLNNDKACHINTAENPLFKK